MQLLEVKIDKKSYYTFDGIKNGPYVIDIVSDLEYGCYLNGNKTGIAILKNKISSAITGWIKYNKIDRDTVEYYIERYNSNIKVEGVLRQDKNLIKTIYFKEYDKSYSKIFKYSEDLEEKIIYDKLIEIGTDYFIENTINLLDNSVTTVENSIDK